MKSDTGISASARDVWNKMMERLKVGEGRAATSVPAVAASGAGSPPGGTAGPVSSGGGNNDPKSWAWWFTAISSFLLICVALFLSSYLGTTDMGQEKAKVHLAKIHREVVEAQEKTKQMVAERTLIQPVPVVRQSGTVPEQVSAPFVPSSVVSDPTVHQMFSCVTEELRDAGFARNEVKRVSGRNEHQFTPGCAVVVIAANIRTMNAHRYVFYGFERNPGGRFSACGDTDMDDGPLSSEECIRFLNDNSGKKMKLVVKDGGSVIINSNN